MSKVSVFDQAWIDLVFEGRNQEYGAYQLRKQDPKTTLIALFSGITLMGLLISIPVLINYFKPTDTKAVIAATSLPDVFEFEEKTVPEPPKPQPAPPQQQQQAAAPQSVTANVDFRPPVVTATAPPITLPTMDDLAHANPGSETNPGSEQGAIVIGGPSGTGNADSTGTATEGVGDDSIIDNVKVDISPEFPGGIELFYKKVGNGFDLPSIEKSMTLRVFVSFVVEKDGSMSNIKVLRDPGYGMGNEAIRVLKSIKTKWKPGIKDSKAVRTAYNLPITLNVK